MTRTLAIAINRTVKLVQVHPSSFKVFVKDANAEIWYQVASNAKREGATRSFLLQCEARA